MEKHSINYLAFDEIQDISDSNQSNQLGSLDIDNINAPFSIFDYFRSREVKWIRREVYSFFRRNKLMLHQNVLRACLKHSNNVEKAKYSINVEHMKPEHIALMIISNHAFDQIMYRDVYVYRGLLNFIGNQYKKLYISAVKEMESLGFISKEGSEKDVTEINITISRNG